MFTYNKTSKNRLQTATYNLQKIFNFVGKRVNTTILDGYRGKIKQNKAYDEGRSRVQWPNGKHNTNPSKAVDALPYPIDWGEHGNSTQRRKAINRFYYFGGYVMGVAAVMGIKLRYGGDWDGDFDLHDQTFDDLVHFEEIE